MQRLAMTGHLSFGQHGNKIASSPISSGYSYDLDMNWRMSCLELRVLSFHYPLFI